MIIIEQFIEYHKNLMNWMVFFFLILEHILMNKDNSFGSNEYSWVCENK